MSTTEKALKAVAEAESLRQSAIKELLGVIKDAEKTLTKLGYTATPVKATAGKTTRNTDPFKKSCPICKTTGHDGRAHRGQGKNKRKFTPAELKDLGLA